MQFQELTVTILKNKTALKIAKKKQKQKQITEQI